MLRILPGVDVLETRFSSAKRILDDAGMNIVGAEFNDGDRAKTKYIVEDYLQREGELDVVLTDAGATSVAATEAFEDIGIEVPIVTAQPAITADNLDQHINGKMPPLHYAMCGCDDMPDSSGPQGWPIVDNDNQIEVSIKRQFRTRRSLAGL